MRILLFIGFMLISLGSISTPQVKDHLIVGKDTFHIDQLPLNELPSIDSILQANHIFSGSTNCYRGYVGEWCIDDNQLLLNKLSCCDRDCYSIQNSDPQGEGEWNLLSLFPNRKFIGNRLVADWYSGEIYIKSGRKFIQIVEGVFITSKERRYSILNGELIDVKTLRNDSPKFSRFSPYSESGHEQLTKYVISSLNWDSIPPLDQKNIQIIFTLASASDTSPVLLCEFHPTGIYELDRQLREILMNLPEWDEYFYHGRKFSLRSTRVIVINENQRNSP